MKLTNGRVSPGFRPEAEITGTYILADIPRHLRPPVVPGHLSQKVTYLFCDELDIVSKELRSRVRQATKDVVKSEV